MLSTLTLPVSRHSPFGELTLRQVDATALEALIADRSNELLIDADRASTAAGTMQLSRIPGMTRRGSPRLLVEAVRVSSQVRSGGIGGAMMRWVTEAAAQLGARLVQLTSDTSRIDAHRCYERLGFVASDVRFKYSVADRA